MKNRKAKKEISLFWPYVSRCVIKPLSRVLAGRWIGQGPKVIEVEKKFGKIYKLPYVVTVNNCTSALHLALVLAGIKEGDEVITTPMTCSATNIPILYQRAKVVFADIQQDSLNIDPRSIEVKMSKKTKAIIIVHWGGYPCDMDQISKIAKKYGLFVIADAAHALGATYHTRPIGGISDYTCFSFQAIKHLTSGDGGILITRTKPDYQRAKLLRWYGIDRELLDGEYWKQVKEAGFKYQMNDITATILIAQLKDLSCVLQRRREIAQIYRQNLKSIPGLKLLEHKPDRNSAHWLFTILVEKRASFIRKLEASGIESGMVHVRCDLYPIFGGKRLELPGMNLVEPRYVSIPLHNKLSDADVWRVVKAISSGW